ncbi:MAG: GAF domain-containing protein [Xanthobacteraceae bacterium]
MLQVISTSSGEVKPVFQSIVENAARLCEAQVVDIILAENNTLSIGGSFGELGRNPGEVMPLDRSTVMGRSICDKQPVQVEDLQNASDEFASGREFARKFGHRTILGVPLIHEDRAWGTILVRRTEVRPFTYKQIELVQNFAAQAVIAIENARLLNELREALRQQTATADVLRVISSSPGDLGPVFDAAIENATRLCGAEVGTLALYNGSVFRGAAVYGHSEQYANVLTNLKGTPPGTALAQLKERRQIVQIADVAAEAAYDYIRRANPDFGKVRAALYVPIVREGALIGAFMIYRHEVRPFTDKQVALVENFAAQAAIAIENARLLNELRESYELVREQATKVEAQSQELLKLNQGLEQRVSDQVGEIERMGRLRRFLPPQVADLIVALGTEKQLESHRREITALFCDLRGFTGFSESSDPEDVMALLRDYHSAIGEIIVKYSGTLERYAGDGVMVVFNDPVPVENPALQAVLMALEMRDDIGALTERWCRLGHDIGFGIGIAHGFATLGTIGFEGRFDYAAIGTVSNVASRLCDEAKPGQILISPRVLMKVEDDVKVEPVGEFTLKGIRRPLAAYNVLSPRTVS